MTTAIPARTPNQVAPQAAPVANAVAATGSRPRPVKPGRERPRVWLPVAAAGLCVLAGAAATVSYAAQYRLVYASRHLVVAAARHQPFPGASGSSRSWRRPAGWRCGCCAPGGHLGLRFLVAVAETPEGRDPAPPGPTGSLLGDALAAVAACAVAAIRWHDYEEEDLDALLGRFGLAAALAPAPGSHRV